MGDVVTTTTAMEAFLLNPTHPSDRYSESQSLPLNGRRRSDQLASHPSKRTLRHSNESFSDLKVKALYWQRYDSDEEALSSADSDTDSIASASSGEILEMTTTRLSIISAEELARSCNPIEQNVHRAQAVTLWPINHGDIKLSPRLVEIPPSPRYERARSMGFYKPPPSTRLSKLDIIKATGHHRSVTSSPRTSLENSSNASTPSTPPTSVDERSPVSSSEKVIRRKSAVAGMRSAAKREYSVNSEHMPDAETMREFLASDPSTHVRPVSHMPATNVTAPTKRKLRKFSSSFSLGRFNPGFSKRSSSAGNSSEELAASSSSIPATPQIPEVYRPTRCSSLQPPPPSKMVARGADERAPPIVLPPCPDDSEHGGDRVVAVRPQVQRSPKSYSPTGAPKPGKKLHRRQRSLSADDIMMAST
jgi:hypothetical protein